MSEHERFVILTAIIDKLDPDEVVERLEWTTEELVDALSLDILNNRDRFEDLLEDEEKREEDKN